MRGCVKEMQNEVLKEPQLSVEVSLLTNRLMCKITQNFAIDAEYFYYLIKDGAVIDRIGWTRKSEYEWELSEAGVYQVQGYAKANNIKLFDKSLSTFYIPSRCVMKTPDLLKQIAREENIETVQDADYMILDPVEILREFDIDSPCDTERLREEICALLDSIEVPVYLIVWDAGCSRVANSPLYWLLEECWHICRTHPRATVIEKKIPFHVEKYVWNIQDLIGHMYSERKAQVSEVLREIVLDSETWEMHEYMPEAELCGNVISAEIHLKTILPSDSFAAYLIKDRTIVVDKTGYDKGTSFSFSVKESGTYYIQFFMKRYGRVVAPKTLPLFYGGEHPGEAFEAFLAQSEKDEGELFASDLKYFAPHAPYADFVVLCEKSARSEVKYLHGCFKREELSLGESSIRIFSTNEPLCMENGRNIYFSGNLLYEHKYRMGKRDLEGLQNLELAGLSGRFCYIDVQEDRMILGTDYIANQRWYYYQDAHRIVISNSYHLLLLTLRKLEVSLRLDTQKAMVTLSAVQLQFLAQNFSRQMDIQNITQLTPDEFIELDSTGFHVLQSEAGKDLCDATPYHESDYQQLLQSIKDELLENARDTIFDSRFHDVVLDLTGGLDSRLVFAIATNIYGAREKIKIHTQDVKGSKDLEIAARINNAYGFSYDDLPESVENISLDYADQLGRSYYLGLYYTRGVVLHASGQSDRAHLFGGYGEAYGRPIYARKFFQTHLQSIKKTEVFVKALFHEYADYFLGYGKAFRDSFVRRVSEELEQIPGLSMLEKLERFYLFYRNSYHFNPANTRLEENYLGVLQSREALRTYHRSFIAHSGIRFQLDMIGTLNPLLLSFPFDFDKDDADRIALSKERIHDARLDTRCDLSEWETSRKRKKIEIVGDRSEADNLRLSHIHEITYQSLMRNFRILMQQEPDLAREVGAVLYDTLSHLSVDDKRVVYWYNKVTSLMDQSNLIHSTIAMDLFGNAETGQSGRTVAFSIFGSCVSRDLFEYAGETGLQVGRYIARESIISAVSAPVPVEESEIELTSPFQKKMVLADCAKSAFDRLRSNKSDFLMIDLIDERFDLIKLRGSLVTASNEVCEGLKKIIGGCEKVGKTYKEQRVWFGDEPVGGYVKTFCEKLREIYEPGQIFLHRALMTDFYLDSAGEVRKFSRNYLEYNRKTNRILSYMYDLIENCLPGIHVIAEMDGTYASEKHKWGLAPMHYTDEYYFRVLEKVCEVIRSLE